MDKDAASQRLNELIQSCLDSEKIFRAAADSTTNVAYKGMFEGYARQRYDMASRLESEVLKLGRTPETSGTAMGVLHRGITKAMGKLGNNDLKTMIAEVEREEDRCRDLFEAARRDPVLPPLCREVVEGLASTVIESHRRISALKQQIERL